MSKLTNLVKYLQNKTPFHTKDMMGNEEFYDGTEYYRYSYMGDIITFDGSVYYEQK